jgi:tryptophan synthase beta chain
MAKKTLLTENELPRHWYNIASDVPEPPKPPLHPGTRQPVGPDDLAPLFPMELIGQEVSQEAEIPIPEEILDIYRQWRPTPLFRADGFEKALGTPARIYFKHEGVSAAGSHKPNTAVAQAYYNKKEGVKRLTTETGAGQWGSALAFGCNAFGMECKVYMVNVSYNQKPYRRVLMETWGAQVVPSPSQDTASGKKILAADPESPGSLGIAISEAVEDAAGRDDTKYSLGSVLNHVLLHQSIIGLEARQQLAAVGETADVVIGCVGGGSNFSGIAFPFLRDRIHGGKVRAVAAEPKACPTLTRGHYAYDFGDTAELTPLMPMHTLGHDFVPPKIHAGGLRYHGMAPMVSHLLQLGLIEARAYSQLECFEAALKFARTEGILPAPETSHALQAVVEEAERCTREGKEEVLLFNFSGHGFFDLSAYDAFLAGKLEDYDLPEETLKGLLEKVHALPKP